jgi:hypothetical protein
MPAPREETLVVQISGRSGGPPTIIEMARPMAGKVPIREWPDGEWTRPAITSEPSCDEMLARLERARGDGRHVSQDAHRIRRWLEGSV